MIPDLKDFEDHPIDPKMLAAVTIMGVMYHVFTYVSCSC